MEGIQWEFSEDRNELYTAFSELNMDVVAKESEVDFTPAGKARVQFKYAGLDSILPVVKEACRKVGLAPIQFITHKDSQCIVTTHVGHKSGQWLEVVLSLPVENNLDPKKFAALSTYLKRYQIGAVFQISCEDDTDAVDLPGPAYSGSDDDKRWLIEVMNDLPVDLSKEQMKAISTMMMTTGAAMDVAVVSKLIEETVGT